MIFITLLLAGYVGLVLHWLKKFLRDETKHSFIDYMKIEPKHSLLAFGSVFIGIVTLVSVGTVDISLQSLALAFLTGFSLDSAANKG